MARSLNTWTIWRRRSTLCGQLLALASLVAGCSGFGGDARQIFDMASQQWSKPTGISLETAAAVPYASIGIRLDGSAEIMLILATDQNDAKLWTSSSRIALITSSGRIIRTAGLGNDLGSLTQQPNALGDTASGVNWIADFPKNNLYSIVLKCQRTDAGEDAVTILGKTLQTRRINEMCQSTSQALSWTFQNSYWKDKDGVIWRSLQYVNPHLGPIELEVLRPPA